MEINKQLVSWCRAIQSGKLTDLASDMKKFADEHKSEKIDKDLLKILIHLCQFASTCDKTNYSLGTDLFKIAHITCSSITLIPDAEKFFSSLYHIISNLIDMKLYKAAQDLCDFFLPGSEWSKLNVDTHKKYFQLSYMWYSKIKSLMIFPASDKQFDLIISCVKFELKIGILAIKNCHIEFVRSLNVYYDKIKMLENKDQKQIFQGVLLKSLSRANVNFTGDKKYEIYVYIVYLMTEIINEEITIDSIPTISSEMTKIFNMFEKSMKTDPTCYKLFNILYQGSRIFIKPVDKINEDYSVKMNSLLKNMQTALAQFESKQNVLKCIVRALVKFAVRILIYWEEYELIHKKNIVAPLMFDMLQLTNFLSDSFMKFDKNSCNCKSNCHAKKDLFNAISFKLQSLNIMQYLKDDLPENLLMIISTTVDQCIVLIIELKKYNCQTWSKFWNSCGARVFNIAAIYEKINPKISCIIYQSLCQGINHIDAISSVSDDDNSKNLLFNSLHRISCTMYMSQNYEASLTAATLNAILSYKLPECKAFRMWANNKHKNPHLSDTTLLQYIETHMSNYEEYCVTITSDKLNSVDKDLISLQEIKALQQHSANLSSSIMAVLDSMESMNVSPITYVTGIMLLGYDSLNFNSNISINKYIKKALLHLKQIEVTEIRELFTGHLKFFNFIELLKEIRNKTAEEMQSAKIRLYASTEVGLKEPGTAVVPSYNLINVKTSADMAINLEKALHIWLRCYNKGLFTTVDSIIDPKMNVRIIKIAAEYAKFYKYCKLEIKIWKLAYSLAVMMDDHYTIIYITSRSITSQYVVNEWIAQALKSVDCLKNSTDKRDIKCIAMFKVSLSGYYYYKKKIVEANKLLDEVQELPEIAFTVNLPTYLTRLDVMITYGLSYGAENNLTKYIETIIKGLYTLLMIEDFIKDVNVAQDTLLYNLDALLQFTDHITMRMNNLLSFREISAHLVRRLSTVQQLASTLHVAECLKNLCYIDLSRNRMDDCEVKLQGLEHILQIETFDASTKKISSPITNVDCEVSSSKIVEPIRDVFQNDTSPVLPKKIFISPDFMEHNGNCKCFKCWNTSYQYLVFSCTYIRAQLYAQQNQVKHAREHFYGAYRIIRKLLNVSNDSENNYEHKYYRVIEYVLFLQNFYDFFRNSLSGESTDTINIIIHTIEICEEYGILDHPVYLEAIEHIFEYRFKNIFNNNIYLTYVVPPMSEFEANNDNNLYMPNNLGDCVTPHRPVALPVENRVKKIPPFISLDKAFVDTLEDEDNNIALMPLIGKPKEKEKSIKVRPIRRKISYSEYSNTPSSSKIPVSSNQGEFTKNLNSVQSVSNKSSNYKVSSSTISSQRNMNKQQTSSFTIKIHVDEVEGSNKQPKSSRSRSRKRNTSSESTGKPFKNGTENGNIDEMVNIFKEMEVTESCTDRESTGSETTKHIGKKSGTSLTSSGAIKKKLIERSRKVSDSESENEIIEPSYMEVRRSRRVASRIVKD